MESTLALHRHRNQIVLLVMHELGWPYLTSNERQPYQSLFIQLYLFSTVITSLIIVQLIKGSLRATVKAGS